MSHIINSAHGLGVLEHSTASLTLWRNGTPDNRRLSTLSQWPDTLVILLRNKAQLMELVYFAENENRLYTDII